MSYENKYEASEKKWFHLHHKLIYYFSFTTSKVNICSASSRTNPALSLKAPASLKQRICHLLSNSPTRCQLCWAGMSVSGLKSSEISVDGSTDWPGDSHSCDASSLNHFVVLIHWKMAGCIMTSVICAHWCSFEISDAWSFQVYWCKNIFFCESSHHSYAFIGQSYFIYLNLKKKYNITFPRTF